MGDASLCYLVLTVLLIIDRILVIPNPEKWMTIVDTRIIINT